MGSTGGGDLQSIVSGRGRPYLAGVVSPHVRDWITGFAGVSRRHARRAVQGTWFLRLAQVVRCVSREDADAPRVRGSVPRKRIRRFSPFYLCTHWTFSAWRTAMLAMFPGWGAGEMLRVYRLSPEPLDSAATEYSWVKGGVSVRSVGEWGVEDLGDARGRQEAHEACAARAV